MSLTARFFSGLLVFVCCSVLAEGFFLPIFVRKQPPQTPAVSPNNPQWGSTSPVSGVPSPYQTMKEYQPYQPPLQTMHMTPLQPVQAASMNHMQYTYEPVPSSPYSQMQFHSVQLVPCLCPINKEVIEQQSQQMKQYQQQQVSQQVSSGQQTVDGGSNSVLVQGTHKITS